jgi:hypothetical protein
MSSAHQTPSPPQTILGQLGIVHPEAVNTKQASAYLTKIKGIPTAPSSLEVYRSTSRGPKYRKIGSRCFYSIQWLDEWANGVEIKIYDPTCSHSVVAA